LIRRVRKGAATLVPVANSEVAPHEVDPEDALEAISKETPEETAPPVNAGKNDSRPQAKGSELTVAIADDLRWRRVFITHGQNRDLVEPIKKLLEFGEMEAVVAVERQSVSKPVPEKVMDDMRRAGAAIRVLAISKTSALLD
jgi:hypothetical protein